MSMEEAARIIDPTAWAVGDLTHVRAIMSYQHYRDRREASLRKASQIITALTPPTHA